MHIPKGFQFSVIEAAIKRPGRQDMALIYSGCEAIVAGMFTTNKVKAAPVLLGIKSARKGKGRAIVVNSGNANAATGEQGLRDAEETALIAAIALNVPSAQVIVSSTGVIGVPLPMDRLRLGVMRLYDGLGKSTIDDVAKAIMTTDTFPKLVSKRIKVGGKMGTITAVCKGAGMIAPNMATMLAFILTDIAIDKKALAGALKNAVERSFNRITIDGDRSTNDTALVMANGMLGNKPIALDSPDYRTFSGALSALTYDLSRLIVLDGEGATKIIEIEVKGAKSEPDAKRCAMAIANSPLVKTAVYGADPNWGRIMAAAGYSGAAMSPEKTDVTIGKVQVVRKGISTGKEADARKVFLGREIAISVNLNLGKASATVLTCDLTEDYIKINAHYTT